MIEQHDPPQIAGGQSVLPVARSQLAGGALPPLPAAAGEAGAWIAGEPAVRDVLGDPLIHAVLRRDGLSLQDLLQAIAVGRRRLAPPAAASDAA